MQLVRPSTLPPSPLACLPRLPFSPLTDQPSAPTTLQISTLSARGSRYEPMTEGWLKRRAAQPSAQSEAPDTTRAGSASDHCGKGRGQQRRSTGWLE